mmetsp:Transcript_13190/g.21942  ORF Transcript_13190/g.21942 Transcript_13190/m.21942 type:complete len:231 (+) Transcript_13190:169-861(+)
MAHGPTHSFTPAHAHTLLKLRKCDVGFFKELFPPSRSSSSDFIGADVVRIGGVLRWSRRWSATVATSVPPISPFVARASECRDRGSIDPLRLQPSHHACFVVRSQAQVILDLLHALTAIGMSHQHTAIGGIGSPSFSSADVPGIADHELEVVFVVDVGAKVGVVVHKLLFRDHAVLHSTDIEGIQEVGEDLFGCLPPSNDIRVLGGIVHGGDLLRVDHTVAVFVELLEGL